MYTLESDLNYDRYVDGSDVNDFYLTVVVRQIDSGASRAYNAQQISMKALPKPLGDVNKSTISGGMIALIVILSIVAVVTIVFGVLICMRRKK